VSDEQLLLDSSTKDSPCTTTLQFFVRDQRVHAVVYMRSNDVIWGLPYDVFVFSVLQEMLACDLGCEVGTYTHIAGSLHLYERHFELANRILQSPVSSSIEMPHMRSTSQIAKFLTAEHLMRTGEGLPAQERRVFDEFWGELVAVLAWFASELLPRPKRESPNEPAFSRRPPARFRWDSSAKRFGMSSR